MTNKTFEEANVNINSAKFSFIPLITSEELILNNTIKSL